MNKAQIPTLTFKDWLENKFSLKKSNAFIAFPNDPKIHYHSTLLNNGVLEEIVKHQIKLFEYKVNRIYNNKLIDAIKGSETTANINLFLETSDKILNISKQDFMLNEIKIVSALFPNKNLALKYTECYYKYVQDIALATPINFPALIECPKFAEVDDNLSVAIYTVANHRLYEYLKELDKTYLSKYLPLLIPQYFAREPLKFYTDFIDNHFGGKSLKQIYDLHLKTNEFQSIYQLQFPLDFAIFFADFLEILNLVYLNAIDDYTTKDNSSSNGHSLFISNQFAKVSNILSQYKLYNNKLSEDADYLLGVLFSSISALHRKFLAKYGTYIDNNKKPGKEIEIFLRQFLFDCQMPAYGIDNKIESEKQKVIEELNTTLVKAKNEFHLDYPKFVTTWINNEKTLQNEFSESDYIKLYKAKIKEWKQFDSTKNEITITVKPYIFDFSFECYDVYIKPLFDSIENKFSNRIKDLNLLSKPLSVSTSESLLNQKRVLFDASQLNLNPHPESIFESLKLSTNPIPINNTVFQVSNQEKHQFPPFFKPSLILGPNLSPIVPFTPLTALIPQVPGTITVPKTIQLPSLTDPFILKSASKATPTPQSTTNPKSQESILSFKLNRSTFKSDDSQKKAREKINNFSNELSNTILNDKPFISKPKHHTYWPAIFNNTSIVPTNRVYWIGTISELYYFINKIVDNAIVELPLPSIWVVTINCFWDAKRKTNFTLEQLNQSHSDPKPGRKKVIDDFIDSVLKLKNP